MGHALHCRRREAQRNDKGEYQDELVLPRASHGRPKGYLDHELMVEGDCRVHVVRCIIRGSGAALLPDCTREVFEALVLPEAGILSIIHRDTGRGLLLILLVSFLVS